MWAVCQQGHEGVVCILALWSCVVFVGLFVGFRWPVDTLLEIGVLEAQGGAVVGVSRLLPSGLASGPLTILNEHFWL